MAIVLDNVVMGCPPVINSAIGTRGQITMGQGRDLQAAQDLSLVLKAGALPVPLKVAEVRNIGPSLGQDSINKALPRRRHRDRAGRRHHGRLLPLLRRARRRRPRAVHAVHARHARRLRRVLTLPGLAGFVLSIGIAVDANVLIFERIREELERGKTVRTAIDEGFRHAMTAIIDSNVSTILTAAVLYQYGTGPVRGFAVTLIAGIVASHGHVDLRRAHILPPVAEPLARRPDAEHLRPSMLRILHDTNIDFIKSWRMAVGLTAAFIVVGLAFLGDPRASTRASSSPAAR